MEIGILYFTHHFFIYLETELFPKISYVQFIKAQFPF